MAKWKLTLDIKPFLREHLESGDVTDEVAAKVANDIGAFLRKMAPAAWLDSESNLADDTLIEIVEEFEALRPDSYADDPTYTPLEDLNNILDRLYEWGDANRVWLGL